MDAIPVSKRIPAIKKIIEMTYPDWRGRKIKVKLATKYHPANYWDGGSRDYAKAIDLLTGEVVEMTAAATNPYNQVAHREVQIPPHMIVVEHSIFLGKDAGIRIFINPESKLLEEVRLALPAASERRGHGHADINDLDDHELLRIAKAGWDGYVLPDGLAKAQNLQPGDFDQDELVRGIRVEFEHTSDPTLAMEIAMGHLAEDAAYYEQLAMAGL